VAKFRLPSRRDALDREISQELQSHIDQEIEHRQKQGMSAEEARRTALRDFGGVQRVREEVQDARGMTFWDVLWQDARFGLRSLRRSPGYLLAAVTILALGIGANTAMFSVIRGVLLKPLPFRDQERIALVHQEAPGARITDAGVSIPELISYRERLSSMRDLVEYHQMNFTLLSQGEPDRVDTGVVSGNFFTALGVTPILGRSFTDADAKLGAEPVLLLTYGYWQEKFGSDPKVIGTAVTMNDKRHTVVGVLPPFPQYPDRNDVYMPTSACPFRASSEATMASDFRSFAGLTVFGWLREGATAEQASTEIRTLAASFAQDHAKDYPSNSGFTGHAAPLREELVRDARPMVLALTLATLLVLVIACANVANLALGRAVSRSRELAVRAALGAGRGRLIRQLVTESLLVSLVGGVLGVLLARVSLVWLVPFIGRFTSRTGQIDIDAGVLMFTLIASVVTGVVCGVVPVIGSRSPLMSSMRDGAVQGGESRGRQRLRAGMVIAQVTVSFVLLIGSTLLLTSVYKLATAKLGFDTGHVVFAEVYGNFSRNQGEGQAVRFYDTVIDRLRAEPGVTMVSATSAAPLSQTPPGQRRFKILGAADQGGETQQAINSVASEDYFRTLNVPLLRGRGFNAGDTADSMPVIIINASMAKFWNGRDPIGSYVQLYSPNPNINTPQTVEYTVVGIVPDFELFGPVAGAQPQSFRPLRQVGSAGRLLVRTAADPELLGKVIRDTVHAVDPEIPVENLQTLETLKRDGLSVPAITAGLLTSFAAVALLITLAGIAGLIGAAVGQRTREFGVRLALGAKPWSIVGGVVRHGVSLVGLGIVAGSAGAYAFSRVIARYLFHTTATDINAYAVVAAVFIAAGALAAFVPAKRIASIDPLTVLRTD
jgi:putative ABC transport system permease protein